MSLIASLDTLARNSIGRSGALRWFVFPMWVVAPCALRWIPRDGHLDLHVPRRGALFSLR